MDLLTRLENELSHVEAALESLEREISGRFPLHIRRRFKTCGKERCRCQRGSPHGPYLYAYVPDPEVLARRREKGWRGSTRREVYLGLNPDLPEGWVEPHVLRELLRKHKELRRRREALLERIAQVKSLLGG